ncbi:ICOS ligand isoform X2 [Suricata suricatta]|uniref:ICOS ligand isoform X2 n=1 Tax=Suricata suricatta TaxID=37032 RepID=UPI00115548A7|nr:ICOS ligand isoform X2 [Suricata suricatta]
MRLRSPGILLLLFSALQANVQETEVRVLVGGDAELSCAFPRGHTFDLNDLYVYWQISVGGGPKTVVTYYLSGNDSAGHEDNHYRDRARLSLESMTRGDFSLRLYNITPQDEQRFHCLVFRKSLEMKKILDVVVTLHVAANYSMPEVTAPSSPSEDEELTFTCTSMNGYPRPNVFWINRTDNSVLDAALQNNTVYLNAQGLYNVVSVLTVRRTPSVNVGCCIENVLLHQNLTATTPPAAAGRMISKQEADEHFRPGTGTHCHADGAGGSCGQRGARRDTRHMIAFTQSSRIGQSLETRAGAWAGEGQRRPAGTALPSGEALDPDSDGGHAP